MLRLVKNEEIKEVKEVSVKDDENFGHWRVIERYVIEVDDYDCDFVCWLNHGEFTLNKPTKFDGYQSKFLMRDLWRYFWNDYNDDEDCSIVVNWSKNWDKNRIIVYYRGDEEGEVKVEKRTWVNPRKKKK